MQFDNSQIFEYKTDWVEYFNKILQNINRDKINNQNKIKSNIIESNQTLKLFLRKYDNIKYIKSKEKDFHNAIVTKNGKKNYLYIDTANERFWVIHNVSKQETMKGIIDEFRNSYMQDSIYLTHNKMQEHQNDLDVDSLGFTLKFEQKFDEYPALPVFKNLQPMDQIGFTMQLWPKNKKVIHQFIDKFRKIDLPINYRSLNFVFTDKESEEVLIKENLYYDGAFTVHRGRDFREHLDFVEAIKSDYSKEMKIIEDARVNWKEMSGSIYKIEFNIEINPRNFIKIINQLDEFKISVFFMYKSGSNHVCSCLDHHTGQKFYIQIRSSAIEINLDKNTCGNTIFRIFTSLQRYFLNKLTFYIDNSKYEL
ncbi:MAG: hypothetical protein GF364_19305 [Candidatus Lokiarchaeota archaeon]|nr:hypothetical protein [Candidatus Lokiarchaeota archaeon]